MPTSASLVKRNLLLENPEHFSIEVGFLFLLQQILVLVLNKT